MLESIKLSREGEFIDLPFFYPKVSVFGTTKELSGSRGVHVVSIVVAVGEVGTAVRVVERPIRYLQVRVTERWAVCFAAPNCFLFFLEGVFLSRAKVE